jgi:hypothetical protein
MATRYPTYTISNIAGGAVRRFRWRGELSDVAIRHARRIGFGGPAFGGDAAHEAAEAWEIYESDMAVVQTQS